MRKIEKETLEIINSYKNAKERRIKWEKNIKMHLKKYLIQNF